MKVIHQHDRRDCGAACLSMIACHFGLKLPLAKVRSLTKTDKSGTNIYGLTDGAKQIGLSGDAMQGNPDELLAGINNGEIKFPFIAHVVNDSGLLHFVVIYGQKNGLFLIADPGKGKVKARFDEFFKRWTGYVVIFEKTPEFEEGDFTKGAVKKYFGLLHGQYKKLVGVFIISLVISLIGIAGSLVFQLVIDNFGVSTGYYSVVEDEDDHGQSEDGHNHDHSHEGESPIEVFLEEVTELVEHSNFNVIFITVIGLYLLSAVIEYLRGYLIVTVAKKIDMRLVLSYYNHIFDLPVRDVMQRQTGEYLSRFSDASAIRDAISGATLTIMLDTVMVIAAGVILYMENSAMFLVSVIIIALYAIIVLCFRKPIKTANRVVMENDAVLQSYFKESIDGVETIKAACAEQTVKDNTTGKFNKFINSIVKANMISISQNTLSDAMELIGMAVILWIGFSMVLSQQITLGALMSFYALMAYFTTPVKNLIELQPQLQTAFVAAERLDDILEQETEKHNKADDDFPVIETIDICNIDFRYGNRELLLENLSISIKRGEKIALVGESGSGKTTIAKLLLNFYSPERGEIKINGKPIQNLDLSQLRNNVAYVDQSTFLFADTIRSNLKLGAADASDEDIYKACETANISSFIDSLPMGLDTFIDENGSNLSGGQKQRLALARALLKKPQLLILDEATSHLDAITEMSIQNVIMDSCSDLSCIIIAHRLSTIKRCDKIFLLEHGTVAECGTHDELLGHQGKYSKLWESYCHN